MASTKNSRRNLYIFIALLAAAFVVVSFFYFQQDRLIRYDAIDKAVLQTDASGETYIEVDMQNVSQNEYNTAGAYFVAYHVYDAAGQVILWEGPRTEIELQPGERKAVRIDIDKTTLTDTGSIVGIDLIREGSYWFSQRNNHILMVELMNP